MNCMDAVTLKLLEQWNAKFVAGWRETAEACAPFDVVEAVARRRCMANLIPECIEGCTAETCIGWRDWTFDAEAMIKAAREVE